MNEVRTTGLTVLSGLMITPLAILIGFSSTEIKEKSLRCSDSDVARRFLESLSQHGESPPELRFCRGPLSLGQTFKDAEFHIRLIRAQWTKPRTRTYEEIGRPEEKGPEYTPLTATFCIAPDPILRRVSYPYRKVFVKVGADQFAPSGALNLAPSKSNPECWLGQSSPRVGYESSINVRVSRKNQSKPLTFGFSGSFYYLIFKAENPTSSKE
jgi:hypothetical protein